MNLKPLLLDHFDATFGHARRKDGTEEPMVFLTLHTRIAGTVHAQPTVWVPPGQLARLIAALQDLQTAAGVHMDRPPGAGSH